MVVYGSLFKVSDFITPYTKKTGFPNLLYDDEYHSMIHTIGSRSNYENTFITRGPYRAVEENGIPKWDNKNDSFTMTKRSKFLDFVFTTSSGNSTVTIEPSQYGGYGIDHFIIWGYRLFDLGSPIFMFKIVQKPQIFKDFSEKSDFFNL